MALEAPRTLQEWENRRWGKSVSPIIMRKADDNLNILTELIGGSGISELMVNSWPCLLDTYLSDNVRSWLLTNILVTGVVLAVLVPIMGTNTNKTKTLLHASFSDEFLVFEQLCQVDPIDNGGHRSQCGKFTFSATSCMSRVVDKGNGWCLTGEITRMCRQTGDRLQKSQSKPLVSLRPGKWSHSVDSVKLYKSRCNEPVNKY